MPSDIVTKMAFNIILAARFCNFDTRSILDFEAASQVMDPLPIPLVTSFLYVYWYVLCLLLNRSEILLEMAEHKLSM